MTLALTLGSTTTLAIPILGLKHGEMVTAAELHIGGWTKGVGVSRISHEPAKGAALIEFPVGLTDVGLLRAAGIDLWAAAFWITGLDGTRKIESPLLRGDVRFFDPGIQTTDPVPV